MSTEEFTTGDYVPKIADELTDSGLQITGSVSLSTCGEQPISEGSLVTPVTPESGCFLPHECEKERQYLADQEKNKQVVTGRSGVPLLRSPKSNKPEDNVLPSPGNTASLPTSENPASLRGKDVQGYLETQASQEKVVVGPNQTVLRTTETDGNVDKHLFLPLTLASLPQGHPSIGNRSVEEVVEENERLKQELDVMRTTRDNHSRVCPLASQSEYVGTADSSGSYNKPLSCSLVQEATTSVQRQTQLETELQQMKEDHQKLLEEYTQMKMERTTLEDNTTLQLSAIRQEYEATLKEKEEQLSSLCSLLQESIGSKDERLAAMDLVRDRLECECRALLETVQKVEKERNEALTAVASWKEQFDVKKAEAKKFKNELSQAVGEKLVLEERFELTKEELEATRRDLEEKRVEAKENERKLSASVAQELGLQEQFNLYKRQHPPRQI